jgi:hypothetical protein
VKLFSVWVLILILVARPGLASELLLDATATNAIVLAKDGLADASPVLQYRVQVPKVVAETVTTDRGAFTELTIPGGQLSGAIGAPAIPVLTRLIEIPFGGAPTVTATVRAHRKVSLSAQLEANAPLAPRQPPQPKSGAAVPFAYDARAYRAHGFQQEELATVQEIGILRSHRLALLTVAPVAYDPATGQLELFEGIDVAVNVAGADMAKTREMKARYASPWMDAVAGDILAPQSLRDLDEAARHPASYVIVADRMFEQELKPFIEWKTQKGFQVRTYYTDQVGNTADKIKTHISGLFSTATAENPAPDYVLFVGDHEQVPAHAGTTGSHITDLYHVCTVGTDNLPDVLTGRFSAQNVEQLRPQIEKTLYYEKAAFRDTSYLTRTSLVAGWDSSHAKEWGWPQIKFAVKYFFNRAHGMPKTYAYYSSAADQNAAAMIKNVSDGCAFVNYAAHGSPSSWADPSFTMTDLNGLKNDGKYGLVVGNCCLTNKFELDPCFGEAWLRADHKGAIGYIGGTNSTYWDEDLWWANGLYTIKHPNTSGAAPTLAETGPGAYKDLFTGKRTSGSMVVVGNLAVEASTTSRKKYYWEIYSLMGDPSIIPFLGVPRVQRITHAATSAAGTTSLAITAPAGTYIGISAGGTLYGAALARTSHTVVSVKPLPAGTTLQVVATAPNMKPALSQIRVP